MLKFSKTYIPAILLFIYFILYALLPGLIGTESASLWKTGIVVILVISIISIYKQVNHNVKIDKTLIPLFIFFFIFQFLWFHNSAIFRWGINFFLFWIFYKYGNYNLYNSWSWAIKTLTIVCTLSVVYLNITRGSTLYYRDEAIADKASLTAFYGITYYLCVIDIMYKKYWKFNLILLLFILIVNVVIIQSKTSLLALLLEVIVLFVFFPKIRPLYRKLAFYFVTTAILFVTLFPNIAINEDLKYGINQLTGMEIFKYGSFERQLNHLNMTYSIRDDIKDYCLKLFFKNPLMGIGYGNYQVFIMSSSNYFNEIYETESTWLQIMVEGGMYYIFCMSYFFAYPIYLGYRKIKRCVYPYHILVGFSFFVVFAIMFFYNDFMDSFFWISGGVSISLLVNKDTIPKLKMS